MEGFIQLQKKICDWEWYTDVPTCKLFFHILLKCNYKEVKWRGEIIKPGDFITSLEHLSQETGLTVRQVRTALEHLEKTGEVTKQSTSQYTILTLTNWASYNTQDDKRPTNDRQTTDKRATTTNKEYKEYKDNNTDTLVATQPNEYQKSINYLKKQNLDNPHIPDFVQDFKNDWITFIAYWTEKGRSGKIRAEGEKTFEIRRRWATWMSRKKETYQKSVAPKRDIF